MALDTNQMRKKDYLALHSCRFNVSNLILDGCFILEHIKVGNLLHDIRTNMLSRKHSSHIQCIRVHLLLIHILIDEFASPKHFNQTCTDLFTCIYHSTASQTKALFLFSFHFRLIRS